MWKRALQSVVWYWHPNCCSGRLEPTVLLHLRMAKVRLTCNFTGFTWLFFRATAAVLIASTSMERIISVELDIFPTKYFSYMFLQK